MSSNFYGFIGFYLVCSDIHTKTTIEPEQYCPNNHPITDGEFCSHCGEEIFTREKRVTYEVSLYDDSKKSNHLLNFVDPKYFSDDEPPILIIYSAGYFLEGDEGWESKKMLDFKKIKQSTKFKNIIKLVKKHYCKTVTVEFGSVGYWG